MISDLDLQDLEDKLWQGVQAHIDRGGTLTDCRWGVDISTLTGTLVKDCDSSKSIHFGSSWDCRCLFGSQLDKDQYPTAMCKTSHIFSTPMAALVSNKLELTEDEVFAVIYGFDNKSHSYNPSHHSYYDLGKKLRKRCQALPQWRGTKG